MGGRFSGMIISLKTTRGYSYTEQKERANRERAEEEMVGGRKPERRLEGDRSSSSTAAAAIVDRRRRGVEIQGKKKNLGPCCEIRITKMPAWGGGKREEEKLRFKARSRRTVSGTLGKKSSKNQGAVTNSWGGF